MARALLKQMGSTLKATDPYSIPGARTRSRLRLPCWAMDGWTTSSTKARATTRGDRTSALCGSGVNAEFAYENSGAGQTHPHHVDSASCVTGCGTRYERAVSDFWQHRHLWPATLKPR